MPLLRINSNNRDLRLVQDNVDKALQPIETAPFIKGNMLTGIALTTGTNQISHGLPRAPQFFVITDSDAEASVWRSAPSDSRYIYLDTTANVTVSVWVS